MDSGLIGAIATIIVAVIALWGSRFTSRSNSNAVDVDTLRKLIADVEAQHKEILKLQNEVEEIRDLFKKLEDKTRVMWQYIYALIDFIKKHVPGFPPPMPPKDLESDPKLMELLK